MKGRSKSCYVLAAAGKEESILLLRQILRGVSGAGQLRVQQVVTLDEIRRGVSGAGAQAPADLLIAVMPLSDGTGIEGIIHVAQRHPQLMTILLVRQEAYEQVTYQCRNQQIFVIAMPFKRQILAEAASFMLRIRTVMDDKDKELVRLKKNLSEIRIITSAKIRLMQTRQMTEEEAHYYLEKEAMDSLEIKQIKKSFGQGDSRVEVLRGIDLSMSRGEMCVLLGPSGSGKSTLLNIIGGIDSADEGEIVIDGEPMSHMSEKKLTLYRRRHLGYIFQMYNLIPNLTVRENIEVGAYLSSKALDVDELLHLLGLWEHRGKVPSQLSGGQQQRTAIGRAVVKNPDILLCDEPTGALDYKTSKEILKLIEQVNRTYGNTVIMVTHNDAIKHMADTVVRLKDGRIRDTVRNEHRVSAQELEW